MREITEIQNITIALKEEGFEMTFNHIDDQVVKMAVRKDNLIHAARALTRAATILWERLEEGPEYPLTN